MYNDTVVSSYGTLFTFHCKTQSNCIEQVNITQERAQIERLYCQKTIKEQWPLSADCFRTLANVRKLPQITLNM